MKYILILSLFCTAPMALAQDDDEDARQEQKISEIDSLYDKEAEEDERREESRRKRREKKVKVPKKISELKILESFDDIAVIQKRYLPKSGRFEFFIGGSTNLNDAFFVGNGLQARLGYHFTERWGVELIGDIFSNANRDITEELKERGVDTRGQVATDAYYGIDLKWAPMYGKYAFFNEKIIPFDFYFSLGVGLTDPKRGGDGVGVTTVQEDGQPLTLHVGTGQIYALTKYMALRWDLSWHFFNIEAPLTAEESTQQNLFFHIGLSFFFPEAKYR